MANVAHGYGHFGQIFLSVGVGQIFSRYITPSVDVHTNKCSLSLQYSSTFLFAVHFVKGHRRRDFSMGFYAKSLEMLLHAQSSARSIGAERLSYGTTSVHTEGRRHEYKGTKFVFLDF